MRNFLILMSVLPALSLGADPIRDFWFNGAEINRYELTQARYGAEHPGHAEFIFVTEPFLIRQQVKQEFGHAPSTDVLKLNALRTFNTGIYSYRTMTSVFRPIDLDTYSHALKTTTSVQEWCGHVFQQIKRTENGWNVELRSYFQKEGDQNFELPDVWLEDEFWLMIRLNPQGLPTGELQAVPGALYTRFAHTLIEASRAIAELEDRGGQSTYRLRYPELKRTLQIRFDTDFPHIIRQWEESGPRGTTRAVLKDRIMNSYYWTEHAPEDRRKRKALGLQPIAD